MVLRLPTFGTDPAAALNQGLNSWYYGAQGNDPYQTPTDMGGELPGNVTTHSQEEIDAMLNEFGLKPTQTPGESGGGSFTPWGQNQYGMPDWLIKAREAENAANANLIYQQYLNRKLEIDAQTGRATSGGTSQDTQRAQAIAAELKRSQQAYVDAQNQIEAIKQQYAASVAASGNSANLDFERQKLDAMLAQQDQEFAQQLGLDSAKLAETKRQFDASLGLQSQNQAFQQATTLSSILANPRNLAQSLVGLGMNSQQVGDFLNGLPLVQQLTGQNGGSTESGAAAGTSPNYQALLTALAGMGGSAPMQPLGTGAGTGGTAAPSAGQMPSGQTPTDQRVGGSPGAQAAMGYTQGGAPVVPQSSIGRPYVYGGGNQNGVPAPPNSQQFTQGYINTEAARNYIQMAGPGDAYSLGIKPGVVTPGFSTSGGNFTGGSASGGGSGSSGVGGGTSTPNGGYYAGGYVQAGQGTQGQFQGAHPQSTFPGANVPTAGGGQTYPNMPSGQINVNGQTYDLQPGTVLKYDPQRGFYVGSAAGGLSDVPQDMPMQLHAGEMVLDRFNADQYRKQMGFPNAPVPTAPNATMDVQGTQPVSGGGNDSGGGPGYNYDFNAFRSAFGTSAAQPGYNPSFDYNGDGKIDLFDFGLLRQNQPQGGTGGDTTGSGGPTPIPQTAMPPTQPQAAASTEPAPSPWSIGQVVTPDATWSWTGDHFITPDGYSVWVTSGPVEVPSGQFDRYGQPVMTWSTQQTISQVQPPVTGGGGSGGGSGITPTSTQPSWWQWAPEDWTRYSDLNTRLGSPDQLVRDSVSAQDYLWYNQMQQVIAALPPTGGGGGTPIIPPGGGGGGGGSGVTPTNPTTPGTGPLTALEETEWQTLAQKWFTQSNAERARFQALDARRRAATGQAPNQLGTRNPLFPFISGHQLPVRQTLQQMRTQAPELDLISSLAQFSGQDPNNFFLEFLDRLPKGAVAAPTSFI